MLLITIAGGLAANVGTVLIVGLALAYLHLLRSGSGPHDIGALSVLELFASVGGFVVLVVLAKYGSVLRAEGRVGQATYWFVIALVAFVLFVSLLVLVGDAAGVK